MNWDYPAWDPVLLDFPGPLDIRWYGLMYVVAFVCGQFILTRLARARLLPVPVEQVGDLIFYCVVGTILGGRVGYALFYDQKLLNPAEFVKVWEGGLAFHGGLLGVIAGFWLFARKHKMSFLRVSDAGALAVTPGILAVRCANFVNGELYGRVTTKATFGAMQFPTDPIALDAMHLYGLPKRAVELGIRYAYRKIAWEDTAPELGADAAQIRPFLDWDKARAVVPYRHPSQLYEALGEGVLLGLVLFVCYRLSRGRPWADGKYGGVFLLGYGCVRFAIEFLRQPDAQFTSADDPIGLPYLGMTMGQTLCSAMILTGLALIAWPRKRAAEVATA